MMQKLIAVLCLSIALAAAPEDAAPVAAAAMRQDPAAVRALLKDGKDVNAAQGDGMTALHWAAMHGDADPGGHPALCRRERARDDAAGRLHRAAPGRAGRARGGDRPADRRRRQRRRRHVHRRHRADAGVGIGKCRRGQMAPRADVADANAAESANGETALMFAAALDRADVVRELLAHGADPARTSKAIDLAGIIAPEETLQNAIRDAQNAKSAGGAPRPVAVESTAPANRGVAGVTRSFAFNELIGTQGGLTALHFAARQGSARSVEALVEHGANVNALSPGDRVSPLLIATVNGQFDIAKYLLAHGADPNLANAAGA